MRSRIEKTQKTIEGTSNEYNNLVNTPLKSDYGLVRLCSYKDIEYIYGSLNINLSIGLCVQCKIKLHMLKNG